VEQGNPLQNSLQVWGGNTNPVLGSFLVEQKSETNAHKKVREKDKNQIIRVFQRYIDFVRMLHLQMFYVPKRSNREKCLGRVQIKKARHTASFYFKYEANPSRNGDIFSLPKKKILSIYKKGLQKIL